MNASPPEDTLAKLGARAKRPDTARTARPDASKVMTVFVLIVVTLYFGREVLVPVTLALLLTFLLAPPVGWFRKIFGRVLSVVLVVTLALGVLIAIGGVIVGQLRELAIDLPNYTSTIESKVVAIKGDTLQRFSHVLNHRQVSNKAAASPPVEPVAQHQTGTQVTKPPGGLATATILPPAVEQSLPSPWELAKQYISPLMSPLATIGIVFVVAVFALLQREDLRDRLIRLIGPDDIHRTTLALDDAGRRLDPLFFNPAQRQHRFWCHHRDRPVFYRRPTADPLGRDDGDIAIYSLCRFVHLGGAADCTGCRGRARLVDGDLDAGFLSGCRSRDRSVDRAADIWPEQRIVAVFGDCLCNILVLGVGPGGAAAIDAAHACVWR